MLLRTSLTSVVNFYLWFGQKNLVVNLNVWQFERFWGGSICVNNMYIKYSYQIFLSKTDGDDVDGDLYVNTDNFSDVNVYGIETLYAAL